MINNWQVIKTPALIFPNIKIIGSIKSNEKLYTNLLFGKNYVGMLILP